MNDTSSFLMGMAAARNPGPVVFAFIVFFGLLAFQLGDRPGPSQMQKQEIEARLEWEKAETQLRAICLEKKLPPGTSVHTKKFYWGTCKY